MSNGVLIVISVIVGAVAGILSNLIATWLQPRADKNKIIVISIFIGLLIFAAALEITLNNSTNSSPSNTSLGNPFRRVSYFGRVLDSKTQQPIQNAKISLDFQGNPLVAYTDSEGVYRFDLPISVDKEDLHIRIQADDYAPYDQNITFFLAAPKIDDIRLISTKSSFTTEPLKYIIFADFLGQDYYPKEFEVPKEKQQEIFDAALKPEWKQSGYSKPSISQVIPGSFTSPNAKEIVYIIHGGDINPRSTLSSENDSVIAIFSGDSFVTSLRYEGMGVIAVFDLNNDGLNELLLSSGGLWMGYFYEDVKLVDVRGGQIRPIQDFGTVINDPCDAGDKDRRVISRSIIYNSQTASGTWPRFKVEYYEVQCPEKPGELRPQASNYKLVKTVDDFK